MKIFYSFRFSGVLLAALALAVAGRAQKTPPAAHPNVLFLVVDDLNTALGCYGDSLAKTPNFDRLAAHGVRFDRAYCQYTLCNPSRVSFLTGRRPEVTGVYDLKQSARAALPDAIMLPEFFRQHDYYTAGAGKIFHTQRMSDPASWDRYEDGPGKDPEEQAASQARNRRGTGAPEWVMLAGDGTATRDGLNAATIRGLLAEKSGGDRPFFLALGFHKPHLPWTAPRRFFDLHREADFERPGDPPAADIPAIALQTELSGFGQPDTPAAGRRAYYACVSFIDHELGLVLDELDRRDLWRSTIVVLVSDHGFHLGDHGGLWGKTSAFDLTTRVPLIIAGAGVPAGKQVDTLVESLDLYPTLVDLAGFAVPAGLDGRSLRAVWQTGALPALPAASLVYHYDAAAQRDIAGRTVITPDWRYTVWDGGGAGRELYRRADDPGEYRNLVDRNPPEAVIRAAEEFLRTLPVPKPGRPERPHGLMVKENTP